MADKRLWTIKELAAEYGMSEQEMIELMEKTGLMKDGMPTPEALKKGYARLSLEIEEN